jgi:hypothetical protein
MGAGSGSINISSNSWDNTISIAIFSFRLEITGVGPMLIKLLVYEERSLASLLRPLDDSPPNYLLL